MLIADYNCPNCKEFTRNFYIKVSDDLTWIMKVGQYPSWDISGSHDVEAMLGEHKALLRKGLISESQGYGIGAFAYYRRIVEEVIDQLLRDISDLLDDGQKQAYANALEQVQKTRIAANKIALVKDLLPQSLRPNNMNPLDLLHGVLSDGLHAQTDEACMESAGHVRDILVFLAARVSANKVAGKAFTASMQLLLDKRAGGQAKQ